MTLAITHNFVSAVSDGTDTTVVRPSDWNAAHTLTGAVSVAQGGIGTTSIATGDLLYGSAANTLAALAKTTTATRYLANTGASNVPGWDVVNLTTGITGVLPIINGGTSFSSYTKGDLIAASNATTLVKLGVGTDGQVLSAQSGTTAGMEWTTSGGGTPGGSDTQVQFNDGGSAFGGDAGLTYSKTTNLLTITGTAHAGSAPLLSCLPDSGASFTKIFDNGTVIIDSDVGTGSNPLVIKYNGGTIFQFNFGGALILNSGAANENISWNSYVAIIRPVNTGVLKNHVPGGAGGTFAYEGKTPTQITGDQNDYQPWGVEPSFFQRWSSDASRNITGLTQSVTKQDGQVHCIVNVGSQNIVLKNLSASSVKTNQFRCSTGADITLAPNEAADIMYDVNGTNATDSTGVWWVWKR